MDEFIVDTAIDHFRVKKIQVQMVKDRGFSTVNLINNVEEEAYFPMTNDQGVEFIYNFVVNQRQNISVYFNAIYRKLDREEYIAFYYLESEKDKKDISKAAVDYYINQFAQHNASLNGNIKNVVFVAPRKLNTAAQKHVDEELVQSGIPVQLFTWIEMLSITPHHVYNGNSYIMTNEEKSHFIKSNAPVRTEAHRIMGEKKVEASFEATLPWFSINDPIPKYYMAKSGDIIQTRYAIVSHESAMTESMFIRRVV